MEYFQRKALRLPDFDYSSVNYYFLTLCSYEKKCIFGTVQRDSSIGSIVRRELLNIPDYYSGIRIDHYVIMPNHIHMILVLEDGDAMHPPVSQIVSCFKAGVSRKVRQSYPDVKIWQRSYYDHVIRSCNDYEKIWSYIENNPLKWEDDRFFINR